MASVPMYKTVYNEMKQAIKDKVYEPGTFLPTEPQLEKIYSTSRTTIRKAVKLLASEGFVVVRQGRGTEVQNISTLQKLNSVTSFTETLMNRGYTVTTQGMCIRLVQVPPAIAPLLNINADETVYQIQRVQCANKEPICIMETYLIRSLFPDLDKYNGTFISLYKFLEKNYGLVIKNATDKISAACADFIDSQILQIPLGSALLISKRLSYTESGPFEYCLSKIIADRYEYGIYLNGREYN